MPVGKTERGRATVRAAELDQRDSLNRLRTKYYERAIKPVLAAHQKGDADALEDARRLSRPDAPYAGMARAIFRRKGLL